MTPELHTGFLLCQYPFNVVPTLLALLVQKQHSCAICVTFQFCLLSGHVTVPPCPLLLSAPYTSFLKCALNLDITIMIQQGLRKCRKLDLKVYIKMGSLFPCIPRGILGETRITEGLPLPGNQWHQQQNKSADKYKGKSV